MFGSAIRFLAMGWVRELYVDTGYHFKYWGFEWVAPLGNFGTHALFVLIAITALMVAAGLFYRFSTIAFFLLFTYAELMDATNYLNHYYFISIVGFLMIWLPANANHSIDAWRKPHIRRDKVPAWTINSLKLQIGLVYFFAGLAKVNPDWLLEAEPLHHWLRSKYDFPILGELFQYKATAYFFSWAGCLYDLTVPFFLLWRKSRPFAFAAVVAFHFITWALFPIGVFPFIMIGATLLFFDHSLHERVLRFISPRAYSSLLTVHSEPSTVSGRQWTVDKRYRRPVVAIFALHFAIQLFLPLRHHLYSSNLFWTEEGYRFSWRVMLTDKAGVAFYTVKDKTGKIDQVNLCDYLTARQQKFLATNPDFMVQFAHFLEREYEKAGYINPEVFVEGYMNLNGTGSRLYTDKNVNLANESWSHAPKSWILPYKQKAS